MIVFIGQALAAPITGAYAARQRKWARTNMKKQIRWRYQDMKAAGINPILAAGGGGGGGLPSGAAASVSNVGDPIEAGTSAYAKMKKALLDKEAAKKAKSAVKLDNANAASAKAQAALAKQQLLIDKYQVPRGRMYEAADEYMFQPLLNRLKGWMGTGSKAKGIEDELGFEATNRRKRREIESQKSTGTRKAILD